MRTSRIVPCAAIVFLAVAGGCNKELQKSSTVPAEQKESKVVAESETGADRETVNEEAEEARPETDPRPLQSWDEEEGSSDTEYETDQSSGTDEEYEPAVDESESESYESTPSDDDGTEEQDYDDYDDYEYDE